MKGGIQAWQGKPASGPEDQGLDLIGAGDRVPELLQTAYGMEMALLRLYTEQGQEARDQDVRTLFDQLGGFERQHTEALERMYAQHGPAGGSLRAPGTETLEGGLDASEIKTRMNPALRTVQELLDTAMMLEAQAMDLYMRMSRKVEQEEGREILLRISDEEKRHLARLGGLLNAKS